MQHALMICWRIKPTMICGRILRRHWRRLITRLKLGVWLLLCLPLSLTLLQRDPRRWYRLHLWRSSCNPITIIRRHDLAIPLRAANTASAARNQDNRDEQPKSSGETNDDGFMVINPASDFAASSSALTAAVGAFAVASAGRAIEQILLETVASAWAEGGRGAGERAAGVVTGVCFVCGACAEVAGHDGLTLQVPACALPRCTGQVTDGGVAEGAVRAIWC